MTQQEHGSVAMGDTEARKQIEEAIAANWGDRCPDFDAGCACCQTWAEYDRLSTRPVQEPVAPNPYGYIVELRAVCPNTENVFFVNRSRVQKHLGVAEACVAHWKTIYTSDQWRFEIVPLYAAPQPAHGTSATERVANVDVVKIARDFGEEELRGTSDFIRGAAYASESIALAIEDAIRQALLTPTPKEESK